MPFQKGRTKTGGRKKGSIPRDRQRLLDLAEKLGVDPFEITLRFAAGDWKGLGYEAEGQTVHTAGGGSFYERTISPELRQKAATDVSRLMLPTLKAVDVNLAQDDGPIIVNVTLGGDNEAPRQPEPERVDPSAAPALPSE